jgi:TIR domain
MAYDVFISHSSKNKAIADAVCAGLEANGVHCWIAPRDITPGLEWGEAIIEGIRECRVMVLVFTADANESKQIRREIERASNHGVTVVPLRVEDVLPSPGLEYFIGNVHWFDAVTPPLEPHLKELAGTLKRLLARPAPPKPGMEEQHEIIPPPPIPKPKPASFWETFSARAKKLAARRAVLGGAAGLIALLAVSYFLIPAFGTSTIKRVWAAGFNGTIL